MGDHVLFWSDGSPSCDAVVDTFLRSAVARHDLIVLLLPRSDLTVFLHGFRPGSPRLDRLATGGPLLTIPTEYLTSKDVSAEETLSGFVMELASNAKKRGAAGVSMLVKLGSLFFARGDQPTAEVVERIFETSQKIARTLCIYESSALDVLRVPNAFNLFRHHSHMITAVGEGRILAEDVPSNAIRAPGVRRKPKPALGLSVPSTGAL